MEHFFYQGLNEDGRTVSGLVDAESLDVANRLLAGRGILVMELTKSLEAPGQAVRRATWFKPVRDDELILFTKQLSTLLKAGIPVLRIFEIMETQTDNEALQKACGAVAHEIRAGFSLHEALAKHPQIFSRLYCSMVLAGESSGALPQVLLRLIYVISHENKVKTDVRTALQYPILVVVTLGVAFVVLLTLVIPRFAAIYAKVKLSLPWPTVVCIHLSDFLRHQWPWWVGGLLALAVAYGLAMRQPSARRWRDRLALHLPMFGPLMIKAALSRFASIFSILQSAGVGILDALSILSETIGNAALTHDLQQVHSRLEEGRGIAEPLRSIPYFTPLFVNMVAVGEESGNLDEMLREIAAHYDAEVEFATHRLTTALGPALIVLLAAVVGFFALAVYLPMWDLAKMVAR